MAGTIGNTNAAKWTRDYTWSYLDRIEDLAWDESIISLSQALLRVKCYKQLWSYWKKKWEQDGDLMDRIYYIEEIFSNKLEEGALFRRLNPSACYFILRHNYGYNTKGERELPAHLLADLEESQQEPAPQQQTQSAATDTQPELTHAATLTPTLTGGDSEDIERASRIRSAAVLHHEHSGVMQLQE